MTHSTLSGNKVRKLEFLLADAIQQGCTSVITCGSIQTNHGRATAVAARELGLDPYLVVRSRPADVEQTDNYPCAGNVLLDRMVGAGIIFAPYGSQKESLAPRMKTLADELLAQGQKAYVIPVGGSNQVGMWGYIVAFQEMMQQGVLENYDDIVLGCGSGGSCCGLAVANYLLGSPLKIHGVCVADNADNFYQGLDAELDVLQLRSKVAARDIIDFVDGYKGAGYGISSDEVYDLVLSVSRSTGVILDPVYTGKAAYGLQQMMLKQPERFKGRRVLFIHTGGVFGTYTMSIEPRLQETSSGQVVDWNDSLEPLPTLPKNLTSI
ncbi:uncharacterized protein LOC135806252 isoform X2 [Sycon ciliatum]